MADYGNLTIIAELAIAFAGFAGVFVVLRHEAKGAWTRLEQVRLMGLLSLSIPTAMLSLVPAGVAPLFDRPETVWRVSASFSAVVLALIGAWMFPTYTKVTNDIPSIAEKKSTTFIARIMAVLFLTSVALYGIVAAGMNANPFSCYYFALLVQLLMCSILFGRILLVRPPIEPE